MRSRTAPRLTLFNRVAATFVGVILLLSLSLAPAFAQITPSGDAYTNSANPTTNFGAKVLLDVQSASQNTYIQFDLSSIPAGYTGANISKATLKLYVNTVPNAGSFNVDFVNGTWSEKTITSSVAPALGSTIAASIPLTSSNVKDYVLIDITPALQAWLNGTQPNDGIALVANSPLNATFDSKESTTQSHPPELDVVFTSGSGGGIAGINTASGSGLQGGGNSGTLSLSLIKSCSNNQVLKWNGSAWACANLTGSGTVTSVALSAPSSDFTVSGSPVTTSGTLGLNWTIAPTSAGTANAIVKLDSTGSFNANSITAIGTILTNTVNKNGINATSSSSAGNGVLGLAHGVNAIGVSGQADSTDPSATAIGVMGQSRAPMGSGVYGFGLASGVSGSSGSGDGVQGVGGVNGVFGRGGASGAGVWAENLSGAWGSITQSNSAVPTAYIYNSTTAQHFVLVATGNGGGCSIDTNGNLGCDGQIFGAVKNFKIDHPLDPANKYLVHTSVESPDNKTVYDGVIELDANGEAWVKLPAYVEALNESFRYQLTAMGAPGPNLYIADEISGSKFRVAGGKAGMKVSWLVTGIRHDAWTKANPQDVEPEKSIEDRGYYLHPAAFGQLPEKGLTALHNAKEHARMRAGRVAAPVGSSQ